MKFRFTTFFFLLIISCSNDEESLPKTKVRISVETPDQIIQNFKVDFVDSSKVKAKLSAAFGYVYEDSKETILDSNIKLVFIAGSAGSQGTILTSDSARIDNRTSNLYAYSNVRIWSDSTQTSLETEFLEWNEKERKLFSTEYVEIISPEERIEGVGFESDQYLNNYKIYKVSGIRKNEK